MSNERDRPHEADPVGGVSTYVYDCDGPIRSDYDSDCRPDTGTIFGADAKTPRPAPV